MTTTARVITVGFITATDKAASKTPSVCVRVCVFGLVSEHVCACLDRPSTKMASEDYPDWDGINSALCVCVWVCVLGGGRV